MVTSVQRSGETQWFSIVQFMLSGLGLAILWGLSFFSIVGTVLAPNSQVTDSFTQDWLASFSFFTLGLLLLPSTLLSLRKILGHPSREINIPGGLFGLSVFLIPIVILAGDWLLSNNYGAWSAPLHIFVALLSVGWLLWIAIHNLKPGSGQRAWGALGTGLVLTPIVAIILEILGGIFFILILVVYIGTNPELSRAVNSVSQLTNSLNPNAELILQRLQPLFNDPFVLFLALVGLGIFIPLVEELLKPIGVMLLLGRDLTPAQGFALGAICGSGYALAENLTVGASADTWAFTAVGRFGTSAMHIFTTALSGYALVRAKNEKRYGALFGIYLLNVLIHGAWNGLVVITSAASLTTETEGLLPSQIIYVAPVLLAGIAVVCILFLRRYNHQLTEA